MRKKLLFALTTMVMTSIAFGADSFTTYAGQWQQEGNTWWYQNDDNSYPVNGWEQIDGNWYYFGGDGYLLTNTTTPDGYQVDSNGAWRTNEETQSNTNTQQSSNKIVKDLGNDVNFESNTIIECPYGDVQILDVARTSDAAKYTDGKFSAKLKGLTNIRSGDVHNVFYFKFLDENGFELGSRIVICETIGEEFTKSYSIEKGTKKIVIYSEGHKQSSSKGSSSSNSSSSNTGSSSSSSSNSSNSSSSSNNTSSSSSEYYSGTTVISYTSVIGTKVSSKTSGSASTVYLYNGSSSNAEKYIKALVNDGFEEKSRDADFMSTLVRLEKGNITMHVSYIPSAKEVYVTIYN